MRGPTTSIIIPTRNEAAYIGPTLAQFENWVEPLNLEIIVSDANSTDGTADIVRTYRERFGAHRVQLVQSEGKQNIAIGRNLGAAAATGTFLLHMDADVRLTNLPHFFEKMGRVFANPKVVAATVPLWVYKEESKIQDRAYHLFMNFVIWLSLVVRVPLAKGECQFVRHQAFKDINGYDEKIVAGEDCNLFYRLQSKGKLRYVASLHIHHSPRRFRKYGYIGLSLIYLREGIWLLFRRKSYSREWTPVR